MIISLEKYAALLETACQEMNPSLVANFAFSLAKIFNSFYVEHSVGRAETEEKKQLRIRICLLTANVLKSAMGILGIRVPERM